MGQLYIFDYDGVIADSLDIWIDVLDKLGDEYGFLYKMTKENVNQLEHVTMDGILEKSGSSRDESAKYLECVYSDMAANSMNIPFFKNIDKVLKLLYSRGNTVCINTANGSSLVGRKFKAEGLDNYVTEIIGGDIPGSKSEKIKYLMEKYSFSPEETWMIGDTRGDIIEGKKAGVNTAAVTYGWHSYDNMLDTDPDFIFRSIEELEDFFLS